MAASLFLHRSSTFMSPFLRPQLPKIPKFTPLLPLSTRFVSASELRLRNRRIASRASSEDLPTELIDEDSKFVLLNSRDSKYGPPAILLLGFQVEEAEWIQLLLKEMDGEFLKMIFCTEDMINRSLWEALHTKQSNVDASKIAASVPRICFLSGLNGEEMMMFIDAFEQIGLESPVFAALVPNCADKPLAELIDEIMGDHDMLTSKTSD